jgi:hypothetical protein
LCGLGISLLGSSLGPEWRKASFKWFLLCSSPCIAMLPAQQQCPAVMLEDGQVVRGSTWRAALWSCSRVRASISYIERARALYRPAGGRELGAGSEVARWPCWSAPGRIWQVVALKGSARPTLHKSVASTMRKQGADLDALSLVDGRTAVQSAPLLSYAPECSMEKSNSATAGRVEQSIGSITDVPPSAASPLSAVGRSERKPVHVSWPHRTHACATSREKHLQHHDGHGLDERDNVRVSSRESSCHRAHRWREEVA